MENLTIIIGAGANKEVHPGIGLGVDLIKDISDRVTDRTVPKGRGFLSASLETNLNIDASKRQEFLIHLDHYIGSVENPSIDEFLYEISSFPEFENCRDIFFDIGRVLIISHVLGYEGTDTEAKLKREVDEKQTWMSVVADLIERHDPSKLSIKIITFNYDRILEFFLLQRLGHSITNFIKGNLTHVYGRIGYFDGILPNSTDEKCLTFGHDNGDLRKINEVKDNIRLLHQRNDTDNVKKIISDSSKILLMGYGLNSVNNARLELNKLTGLAEKFCFNIYPGPYPNYNFDYRRRAADQVRSLVVNADIHYKSCVDFMKTCVGRLPQIYRTPQFPESD